MSVRKMGRTLPKKVTQQIISAVVVNALQETHQNDSSIVKQIGRKTGINLHTIKKWLNALYTPESVHLITLAQHYPKVLEGIIELSMPHVKNNQETIPLEEPTSECSQEKNDTQNPVYRVKYVPINVMVKLNTAIKMNHRQLWFLGELQSQKKLKADDISFQWEVSQKTAKRDIANMLEHKLIRYNGARKNGFYTVI